MVAIVWVSSEPRHGHVVRSRSWLFFMVVVVLAGTVVAMGLFSSGDIASQTACHLHVRNSRHHGALTSLVRQ